MRHCVLLATLGVLLVATDAAAAPISFNTALAVGDGEFVARGLIVVSESAADPSGAQREQDAMSLITVLGYGLNSRLALFGVLPIVNKELGVGPAAARVNRTASGLGDVSAFLRFTLLQRDFTGRTLRLAPFAGVKAPSGNNGQEDAIGRLPPGVQPGSGAWDLFGGVTVTYQTLAYQIDSQLSYRIVNKAAGFDPGDELRLDGSLQYRLWPKVLGKGVPDFLYGVLEANLMHRGQNAMLGTSDANSGGTTIYLSPGLQYVSRRWIAEGIVQLPLLQNLHGNALENDYVLRVGLRFNF